MALTQETRKELYAQYGQNAADTGSAESQVAVLSARISHLTEHLKEHKKDFATRRGLLILVGRRRRLLNYLKLHRTPEVYRDLLQSLNLRK